MADGVIGYLTKPCDANEVLACVSSALERSEPGPYAGFGQANDPHRDSRRVRIGVTITSPTKCMFKTVVTTEYSRGTSGESFGDATSEVATLDFNKVRWIDIEDGDSPNVVIAHWRRNPRQEHRGCPPTRGISCSSSPWPFATARHWASFVTGRTNEPR